jgi:anti-sigma-K factor RskA
MTCGFEYDDAAYVLGALSPAERAAFEQHLPGCASCREAVSNVAVLPGLLRRLGEPQEPQASAPQSRLPELIGLMHKLRRRRKWQSTAVAVAVACVALFAGVMAGSLRGPQGPQMIAMEKVAADTAVTAEVSTAEVPGGTKVTMRCVYPVTGKQTRPYTFRLVAVGADGSVEQIGSWMAGPGDDLTVSGTVRFGPDGITRLELRSRDGTALLILDLSAS